MTKAHAAVSPQRIEDAIVALRGEKVLLDADLAELYGVSTKVLNQAVKRNRSRFPSDFMFRLTSAETSRMNRSQIVTGSQKHRDPRFPPYAFTEQGVAMLSSVLHSQRAVQVNIEIMRAFVRLRQILAVNAELARRLEELERRVGTHDDQFIHVIRAIRQLMAPPSSAPRGRIGFQMPSKQS
jgi:ORF6N domain-containing protein